MELNFFDYNVRIGKGNRPVKETPEFYGNVETLIKEMDYFGIQDALVFHRIAQEGSTHLGNKILMEEISEYKNLHPCWVLSPHVVRKEDRPENLIKEMKTHGVKAVRLFPQAEGFYGYPFTEWMCGDLLKGLERERIPVLLNSPHALDSSLPTSYERLNELCRKYPELPVIVGGWGIPFAMNPLLGIHKNLYLNVNSLSGHERIEFICRNYGAERLIFGTRFGTSPFTCLGASITVVTMADIKEEDKQKIAGDNLRRLLKIPLREKKIQKTYSSPFIKPIREGRPIKSEIIIDSHAHNGIDEGIIPNSGPKGMVKVMDRLGIDVACISCSEGITGADGSVMNDLMVETVKAFPKRFIGYTRVDPNYPEEIEKELNLRLQQANIRHIKVHPVGQNYPITGENYRPAWEFALKHKSVVLSHSTVGSPTCSPKMFDGLAEKYPDITFIIGHSGNDGDGYKEAIEVAKKRKNIYLETSGWCMTSLGVVEYVVERIGAERILFGTDFAFIGAPFQMGAIAYARISDEDKRKIMGLNAARLFSVRCKLK